MARRETDWGVDVLDLRTRRRLVRKQVLTRFVLSLERLIPPLWLPFGLALVALALSASGFWRLLPAWLHFGLLGALVLGAAGTLILGLLRFRPVEETEALRHLEADSGLHRPLTAVRDDLALGRTDAASQGLWQAHRRQMAAKVHGLAVPPLRPQMPGRDPLALRFVAVFVCLLGLALGGTHIGEHLQAAVTPPDIISAPDERTVLEAWITPPAYTGQPPIFISSMRQIAGEQLIVPERSRLLARYHGEGDVVLDQAGQVQPFDRMTDRDLQIDAPLTASGRVAIQQDGDDLGAWNIQLRIDTKPIVQITEEPQPTLRGALRVAYAAQDDYGLSAVAMRLKRTDKDEEMLVELPLPGRRQQNITDVVFRDLTAHRWAGLEVDLTLEVTDDPGQTGVSQPVRLKLPSRQFKHPVARAVVEQRRKLIEEPVVNRDWVVRAIRALQINPESYNGDFAAHLMLSMARAQLRDNWAEDTVPEVEELLWRTALRIEEGQLALALNKLRDIQDKLMEALANGASEEEINRLLDELQQAMDEYLQAMQQQALENMQRGQPLPEGDSAQQIQQNQLHDMLDRARELSQSGSRDRAREMLSQLQNMLENLQMGNSTGTSTAEQQVDQLMDDIGRLMERQQQLRDQTFERQQRQQNPNGRPPSEQSPFTTPGRNRFGRSPNMDTENPTRGGEPGQSMDDDLRAAQERLRRQLGELMRRMAEGLGRIPGEIGDAESAMRDAERSLSEGNRPGALGSQADALDQLRRGVESVLEDLANRGQNPGQMNEGAGQAGMDGEQTDPLGRSPSDSWGDPDGNIVPGKGALQQSREILDELRKRSGQRHRSIIERNYIERLLKHF